MPPVSEALSAQIVELLPRLRRFARSLAGNVSDADDLVQVAIERALAKCDQLHDGAPLAGWLFGILRNAWIDEARSRARRRRVFVAEELGEQVADPNSAHTRIVPVQQAMERLPDEQREVIGLVLIEGLSYREAADIIGVPVGTITSRLGRGREALQNLLGGSEQELP
jgi:RNA polymerase sigma-70 factor (ECF subfamily)